MRINTVYLVYIILMNVLKKIKKKSEGEKKKLLWNSSVSQGFSSHRHCLHNSN